MLENGAFAQASESMTTLSSGEESSTTSSRGAPDYMSFLEKRNKIAQFKDSNATYDKKAASLVNDFCMWGRVLGEDGPAINEETIAELFAPAYRKHKARSAVQVVQLGTIPLELRALAGLQPVPPDPCSKIDQTQTKKRPVRYRYGAWYLRPSTWKRAPTDEKLEDPHLESHKRASKLAKEKSILHEELAKLHGAQAFRKYLTVNGKKEPVFMQDIIKLQDNPTNKSFS